MKTLLELLPTDIGRPISHFAQRFTGGDWVEDARKVLERLVPAEAEVKDDLGRWYIRNILPYRTEADRISGVVVTFTEITERKGREQEVNEAKEFAETIVQAMRFPLVVLTPELRVRSANPAFYETFQVSPDVTEGRPLAELGNLQWDIPELHQRSVEGPARAERVHGHFETQHHFNLSYRHMALHARPLDGAQLILLGMVDLTERKRGERERELLARELNHRVKNILAGVAVAGHADGPLPLGRGVSRQVRRSPLGAGACAQPVAGPAMAGRGPQGAGRAGAPGVPGRPSGSIEIDGEPVPLTASHSLGLSLILHELGTNAAKYGALSHSKGRYMLSWRLEGDKQGRRLRLRWEERGGPAVEPPTEKGFGMRLIERACTYELEGEMELDYAPAGLRCEVVVPLA